MALASHFGPVTWDDVQALPPDGLRYESTGEVLIVTPPPARRHQAAVSQLHWLLKSAAPPDLVVLPAPFAWSVSPTEWYEPDVLVFPRSAPGELKLEVPPLLAVEVSSPTTQLYDLNVKRSVYAANGCLNYWIVDPDEPSLLVLSLDGAEYREVARVVGESTYKGTEPFAVTVCPAELIAG